MNGLPKIRPVLRSKKQGGAPNCNRNALKTGLHTGESRARRAAVRARVRHARLTIALALAAAACEIRDMREI
jgi:hypothetical protein